MNYLVPWTSSDSTKWYHENKTCYKAQLWNKIKLKNLAMNYNKSKSGFVQYLHIVWSLYWLRQNKYWALKNPKGGHKYQICLHNISVTFQSLNITPILLLVKWRYGHWNKLLQNKLGCEFRRVSKVCAHIYSKINIR